MRNFCRLLGGLLILACPLMVMATTIHWRADAPKMLQVQATDNVWGIAARFLKEPWQWSELQLVTADGRQQAGNERLFAGDILRLRLNAAGHKQLVIEHGKGVVRLSPRLRMRQAMRPIPTIPLNVIHPFLQQNLAVDKAAYIQKPYVVAIAEEHVTAGAGSKIYARNLPANSPAGPYQVYRLGEAYQGPRDKKPRAYNADYIANIYCQAANSVDTATSCVIKQARQEVLVGDRLFPANTKNFSDDFLPKSPNIKVNGQIIGVLGGLRLVGRNNSVVIDQGKTNGIQVGDVLAIYRQGGITHDPIRGRRGQHKVKLPDTYAGELLVYRVFDTLSYGLVMNANRPLMINDLVRNPLDSFG